MAPGTRDPGPRTREPAVNQCFMEFYILSNIYTFYTNDHAVSFYMVKSMAAGKTSMIFKYLYIHLHSLQHRFKVKKHCEEAISAG